MGDCIFIVPQSLAPEGFNEKEWNEIPASEMRARIPENMPKLWGENQSQLCFHSMTNLEIYVDEEAGTAKSYCRVNVFQGVPEISFPCQSIGFGNYQDTFKRVDGKWCFETHRIDIEVFGDTSQHFY